MTVEELALALQKIYLAVGVVITAEEAREILNRQGAGLGALPPDLTPAKAEGRDELQDAYERHLRAVAPRDA